MLKHETTEIKRWGNGDRYSHRDAEKCEPKITKDKLKNTRGFWIFCQKEGLI